ncbi:hypothetical protein TEA_019837 [Camellia sinensis var. sinensis]|uniref:Malic enzyme NAD-binding domain-containing protein n=1 Tax=Camellia sinensis var. sinensis TaxID=542762 RepID=A0A4V3WN12_CAMSN|nr:hypothetical protein TEA_019837 [Camellia sinensis var. sinensis]
MQGLITTERKGAGLAAAPFAKAPGEIEGLGLREGANLVEMVKRVKPHVLLGLSGVEGIFNEQVGSPLVCFILSLVSRTCGFTSRTCGPSPQPGILSVQLPTLQPDRADKQLRMHFAFLFWGRCPSTPPGRCPWTHQGALPPGPPQVDRAARPPTYSAKWQNWDRYNTSIKSMAITFFLTASTLVLFNYPSECTAVDAFNHAGENIVFASGSPFKNIDLGNGKVGHVNQANNMYLFPGIGMGALLSAFYGLVPCSSILIGLLTMPSCNEVALVTVIMCVAISIAEVGAAVVRAVVVEELAERRCDVGPRELR